MTATNVVALDRPLSGAPGPYCTHTVAGLRCAKRPHTRGHHVGLGGTGEVQAWWSPEGALLDAFDPAVLAEIDGLAAGPVGAAVRGPAPVPTARDDARAQGFTGDMCPCGSMQVVRNGSCLLCRGCGSTTGCS